MRFFVALMFLLPQVLAADDAVSYFVPRGFEPGCNPCLARPHGEEPFSLTYATSDAGAITQIALNRQSFSILNGKIADPKTFPPFTRVAFRGTSRRDIYALDAASGGQTDYAIYFLRDARGFHMLGHVPRLTFDRGTGRFVAREHDADTVQLTQFEVQNGKLVKTGRTTVPAE